MLKMELIVNVGAANTVIYERKKGIVLNEPSLVAVVMKNGKYTCVAAGNEALSLASDKSRDKNIEFFYPVNNASIEKEEACKMMLKYFFGKLSTKALIRPIPVVTAIISCGLTSIERKRFESIFLDLNVKNVTLIEAPLAALPDTKINCRLITVFGASVTDVAVVGESGIVTGCSINLGGNSIDRAFKEYVYQNYGVIITQRKAEEARKAVGTLSKEHNIPFTLVGKDVVNDSNRTLEVTSTDMRKILLPAVNNLISTIEAVIQLAPDTLQASIQNSGVFIYGGIANTHYLDNYIKSATGLDVHLYGKPTEVTENCAKFFEDKAALARMLGVNLGGKK
ncbi:MAG: rod shape-determining protein [Clostridia bacterium]|nr:rod shape-determining protein [Clostridia bacterium]